MRKDRAFARLLDLDRYAAPQEICYLVGERQTLVGEIDRMRKGIERFPFQIEERTKVIEAIDLVLARHKLSVDATAVQGMRRNKPRLLPYGHMQQFILRVFREAPDGAELKTFTISSEVHRFSGLQLNRKDFNTFHSQVLKSLNHIQKTGIVVRINKHDSLSPDAAIWRLAD